MAGGCKGMFPSDAWERGTSEAGRVWGRRLRRDSTRLTMPSQSHTRGCGSALGSYWGMAWHRSTDRRGTRAAGHEECEARTCVSLSTAKGMRRGVRSFPSAPAPSPQRIRQPSHAQAEGRPSPCNCPSVMDCMRPDPADEGQIVRRHPHRPYHRPRIPRPHRLGLVSAQPPMDGCAADICEPTATRLG